MKRYAFIFALIFTALVTAYNDAAAQDSLNVRRVGQLTYQSAAGICISDNYAYIAEGYFRLRIVNISNPAIPLEVGFYDTTGPAWGVATSGNYAYIANSSTGLWIVNIANSTAPFEVGNLHWVCIRVTISSNYAYVTDGSGLRIVNITDPAAPFELGYYNTPGEACDVAFVGNYAYVADGYSGLSIVNVANPVAPFGVGFYDTPGYANGVAVSGDYAYVADGLSGLRIVNITNAITPFEVGFFDTPGNANGVAVSGNYVYVADDSSGLCIVNVSSPAAPSLAGFYDTPGIAYGVAVSGNYAYVADYDYFGIYDCSQAISVVEPVSGEIPKAFWLAQNYPNPFNSSTIIEYALPKSSRVKLELFDVTGRLIATPVTFNQNPGIYRTNLNVANLSSGNYFYRLSTGDFTATRTLTVVK